MWNTVAFALAGSAWGNAWWVFPWASNSRAADIALNLVCLAAAGEWLRFAWSGRSIRQLARSRRWTALAATGVLLGLLVLDAVLTLHAAGTGQVSLGLAPPASAVWFGLLLWIAVESHSTPRRADSWRMRILSSSLGIATAVVFAFVLMLTWGRADYTRTADGVLVFGARVYANGQPSLALSDRVRTACDIVKSGQAHILLLSGGPGDGSIDEPTAMARLAQQLDTPSKRVVLDSRGLDTARSVDFAAAHCPTRRCEILAVSHGYHLPRIRIAMHRHGLRPLTVPAEETRTLQALPWYMVREAVAFWVYYLGLRH